MPNREQFAERFARAKANGGVYPGNIKHGSNGYTNYGCRCPTCMVGHNEAQKVLRAQRWAATRANGGVAPGDVKHGRPSTYFNWGCHCDECLQARTQKTAAWSLARTRRRRNTKE